MTLAVNLTASPLTGGGLSHPQGLQCATRYIFFYNTAFMKIIIY